MLVGRERYRKAIACPLREKPASPMLMRHAVSDSGWATCFDDPMAMVARVSVDDNERKLGLYLCAVWRTLCDQLSQPEQADVIRTEFAIDSTPPEEAWRWRDNVCLVQLTLLERMWGEDGRDWNTSWTVPRAKVAAAFFPGMEALDFWGELRFDFEAEVHKALQASGGAPLEAWHRQRARMCDLARELFGFPGTAAPAVLQAPSDSVRLIAAAIYDEGRFEDLPRLAEALKTAGCEDEAVLAHCRRPKGHRRGCWVVDLLLDKSPPIRWVPASLP